MERWALGQKQKKTVARGGKKQVITVYSNRRYPMSYIQSGAIGVVAVSELHREAHSFIPVKYWLLVARWRVSGKPQKKLFADRERIYGFASCSFFADGPISPG